MEVYRRNSTHTGSARAEGGEFNWILHIARPVISTAALIYVTIKSFQPFPSFPYNYAPLIDGIWLATGLIILDVLWLRKKDDWLAKAGSASIDADVIPELGDSIAGGRVQQRGAGERDDRRPWMAELTLPAPVSLAEFDAIFDAVKNWGRWGPDDELGTLNYITPDTVRAAAALVRSGRQVTMSIPLNTVAGPDNPSPAIHHVVQGHDVDIGSGTLTSATDYLGLAFHGDCHTHMDAPCHIAYRGQVF